MTQENVFVARAHGRVNLIGEHTDYNHGFVLPTPIPQQTTVRLTLRDATHAADVPNAVETAKAAEAAGATEAAEALDPMLVRANSNGISTAASSYVVGAEQPVHDWIDYVQGVTHILARDGHTLRGFDVQIDSNVPIGSGVSSSAALEIALLRALRDAFALPLSDVDLARIGQRAENDFVGAPVGIMDQMVCSLGQPGQALFLDTDSLTWQLVPLPRDAELVVIDSLVRHNHASGDYRTRRAECERACEALGVKRLRDIDPVSLEALEELEALPEPLGRRARHVVTENRRVLQMVEALRHGRLDECGRLLREGHISMRDDFEISVPEVDALVDIANAREDVYGARMTGGGFGGAIIALVHAGAARAVADAIVLKYRSETGKPASVLVPTSPS
jgi:galactokinase